MPTTADGGIALKGGAHARADDGRHGARTWEQRTGEMARARGSAGGWSGAIGGGAALWLRCACGMGSDARAF